MTATLARPASDELRLPAGAGIAFVDAATGEAVVQGLTCRLRLRRDGGLLGHARVTASGVHHWPDLAERWRPPGPAAPVRADVLVQDEQARFLPLSLPWPLPAAPVGQVVGMTAWGPARLLRVSLLSAPGRPTPPGLASVYGLLVWQDGGAPAAWARVSYLGGDGRACDGGCDAQGRMALHLPRPRPDRPGSPPAPAAQLRVFSDPSLAADAQRLGAPDVQAFAAQPEVRARRDAAGDAAYAPPPFVTGEPLVLATLGLPPTQRELRLAPL